VENTCLNKKDLIDNKDEVNYLINDQDDINESHILYISIINICFFHILAERRAQTSVR
jgi:hypothetical protein